MVALLELIALSMLEVALPLIPFAQLIPSLHVILVQTFLLQACLLQLLLFLWRV
jgi:hypothetical protein